MSITLVLILRSSVNITQQNLHFFTLLQSGFYVRRQGKIICKYVSKTLETTNPKQKFQVEVPVYQSFPNILDLYYYRSI
jgi:hypothetical protein